METNHFVEVTEWNTLHMQPSFQNSALNDFLPFPFLPSSFHRLHTVPTLSPKMLAYEVVLVKCRAQTSASRAGIPRQRALKLPLEAPDPS